MYEMCIRDSIEGGEKAQILKGATGTGKTYTMSQVIQRVNKPTLVIAHNKTCLLYTSQDQCQSWSWWRWDGCLPS